jgi:hypothetical protein
MPFSSQKQEAFMNANRSKMENQGVNMDEWNAASKGKKLPKKVNIGQGKQSENTQNINPSYQ